ncbi:MAG: sensor histidine kinase, partial [Planctomycetota bacterium]
PYVQGDDERVTTEGEHLFLPARMTTPFGMVLNELATNAIKHGALSLRAGKIDARWRLEQDGNLEFVWIERGGPPAAPPHESGFGLRLVRGLIEHELDGEVTFDFEPGGLRIRLRVPMVARLVRPQYRPSEPNP